MPQNRSAGVDAREIDNTGPAAVEPVGIPPGIISTTAKGPAFVPVTVPSMNAYINKFGGPTDKIKNGPLAANEWLNYHQSLMQLRVLGAGDGTARNANGSVTNSGFVVGAQQPQSTLAGALGANPYANVTGVAGRVFMLGSAMSQSMSSSYFSDAGQSNTPVVLRGMIFAASGVIPLLSSSRASSTDPGSTGIGIPGALKGFHTGSVNMTNSEFVILLNGHKGSSQYPRVVTASFDMSSQNYFGNVLNKDPLKMEQAGHMLYSWFDIHSSVAVVTGSGVVLAASGSGAIGSPLEDIAFLVSSSAAAPNLNTTNVPNYDGFEDRFKTASSPWVISQKFGGAYQNLFKVWMLDDGAVENVKISIENINPSTTDTYQYGSFDLVVRPFSDYDSNKVVLEQFRGVNLDPTSNRFIGRIIGDSNTYFNFDASEGKQRLHTEDGYANKSSLIRVEISEAVKAGEMNATALPTGFRGNQHLVTSGSAPFAAFSDTGYLQAADPFRRMMEPPVPMRLNLNKGASAAPVVDRNLYWGVQFEQVVSSEQPNSSTRANNSLKNWTKYYPSYAVNNVRAVVRDNPGAVDTAADGILDADRFNNNLFNLDKIKVKYNSVSLIADTSQLTGWSYVRIGNIAADTGALTRGWVVSDLSDSSVRQVSKFSFFTEGGFNGTRIFNEDASLLTNTAITEEMLNTNRGLSSGPTVKSYMQALNILKDTSEVDIQLLVMPDVRHPYVVDNAIRAMEVDRFDAMLIFDIEQRDSSNLKVTTPSQVVNVKNTVLDFKNRGMNSSFAAAYFPDVLLRDRFTRSNVQVPPSVAVLGAFAKNDALGHPWTAAAGFTRGALASTDSATVLLSKPNMNDLYAASINPIVAFANEGPVVWGQKTVLATQSAFERINVRRLLISIRRDVKKVANRILFEQNREATLARFKQLVTPILKRVQEQRGVDGFRVDIDATTTTQADVENKTIRGQIWIQPTKTLEFMSLDFVVNNAGASVS